MKSYSPTPVIEIKTVSSKLRGSELDTKTGSEIHWLPGKEPHKMHIQYIDGVTDEGRMALIELIELTADVANGEELIVEVTQQGAMEGRRVSRLVAPRITQMISSNERTLSTSSAQIVLEIEYSHMELHDII